MRGAEMFPRRAPGRGDVCGLGRILLISPHLDDAVFACGRLLASSADALVATVFAGRPPTGRALADWDRASGFQPGDDVIGARREEDRQALAVLGAWPWWLDLLDSQYGNSPGLEEIAFQLRLPLMQASPDAVFFPLGLFHSDHRLTHAAALILARRCRACRWYIYEDALYRRIDDLRDAALDRLRQADWRLRPLRLIEAADAGARKREAVACYRSQLRALTTPGRPGLDDLAEGECYWQIDAQESS